MPVCQKENLSLFSIKIKTEKKKNIHIETVKEIILISWFKKLKMYVNVKYNPSNKKYIL